MDIPNSVTHIGNGAFLGNVNIIQGNNRIEMIDGVATVLRRKKNRDEFSIWQGKYFNTKKECFVAKRGEYFAHGDTIKDAIEDVNFKFLQENSNTDEIVNEVKQSQKMSISQFRFLTGACRSGCNNFLKERGVEVSELPLNDALLLIKGAYGWGKISNYFS